MTSINTLLTTDSAEAVLPRWEQPLEDQDQPQARSRLSIPVSLSDLEFFEGIDSMHGSSRGAPTPLSTATPFIDALSRPASTIPQTLETSVQSNAYPNPKILEPSITDPPSPTDSVWTTCSASTQTSVSTVISFSSSSSSGDGDTLSIKAVLDDAIVILRVSRDIEWGELRRRIFNKFIGQQGIPLSKDFTIAVLSAKMASPIAQPLEPVSGLQERSIAITCVDKSDVRIVDSQLDWETVAYSTEGTKLILKIFDVPA